MSATGAALEKRITADLDKVPGCRAIRQHGSMFTRSGEPDIAGAFFGMAFRVEVKSGSGTMSEAQKARFSEWRAVGVICEEAREGFDAREFLKRVTLEWERRTENGSGKRQKRPEDGES